MEGFDIEVVDTPSGKALYFPFMAVSDIHLGAGSGSCKAEELCQMFENTVCDTLKLPGDIFDAEKLMRKSTAGFDPWQRQVVAHILRKAGTGTDTEYILGNHEIGLRSPVNKQKRKQLDRERIPEQLPRFRDFREKSVLGVRLTGESFYTDPSGKKFKVIHRDRERHLENRNYEGILCGHTHRPGIRHSNDKTLVNCGCCSQYPQAAVHDRNGNWSVIEWHQDGLVFYRGENRKKRNPQTYKLTWQEMGVDPPAAPVFIEDKHTAGADKILKLVHLQWPARDAVADLTAKWNALAPATPVAEANGDDLPEAGPGRKQNRTVFPEPAFAF